MRIPRRYALHENPFKMQSSLSIFVYMVDFRLNLLAVRRLKFIRYRHNKRNKIVYFDLKELRKCRRKPNVHEAKKRTILTLPQFS